jgi:hypothetical protein
MNRVKGGRSRFQVICDGGPAWYLDGRGCYHFDGQRFWAIHSWDRRRLIVSWQAPSFGWTNRQPEACPPQVDRRWHEERVS